MSARERSVLLRRLRSALPDDDFWTNYLETFLRGDHPERSLHVAVFQEPFLTWVVEGKKRVESRFSQNHVAPYGRVSSGDAVALKRVGGPVLAICHVRSTASYQLEPRTWVFLREKFAELICATDDAFWDARREARFATLMFVDEVRALPPLDYPKSDRRGWVIDCAPIHQQTLDF